MNIDKLKIAWNSSPYKTISFEDVFCNHTHYVKRSTIKKFLIEMDYLSDCCSMCGLTEWVNKSITLQLDHIDGDRHNNQLNNLRLLCPNCHSQTPTFSTRKNSKVNIKEKKNDDEFSDAIKTSENARQALMKLGLQAFGGNYERIRKIKHETGVEFKSRTSKIPPMEELLDKLCKHSLLEIGKQYGVSDNAVRRWLRKYGIPCSKKSLKAFLIASGLEYTVKWRIATNHIKGEGNKGAKLNNVSVREIRKLNTEGYSQRNLAKLFGVSKGTIKNVLDGKSWAHVE